MSDARPPLTRALRLMVITDRGLAGEGWLEATDAALAAGATAVQLREKQAPDAQLLQMARATVTVARRHGALVLINDRFDIALAAGAHGTHLGEADLPIEAVRAVVPREFVIGHSADRVATGRAAAGKGADYLGVGSVFGTRTKPEVTGEVIGTERLAEVAAAVPIPVIGIGGITAENAYRIAATGAAGVAVVSAIMAAADPAAAARALLEAWGR